MSVNLTANEQARSDSFIARRWQAQGLANPAASMEEAATRLLAMQAQDSLAVLWAVGRRASCCESDVVAALESGALVRTWPMRGTLHLMASADVRWMVGLLAPRMLERSEYRRAELEIDTATLMATEAVLLGRLAQGPVPRDELLQALESNGIRTSAQRGYHLLWYFAHKALLCCGPKIGKAPSFVLLDSWVPAARALPRDEALALLVLRYFSGHGPATVHDLARWADLRISDVRAGLSAVAGQLSSAKLAGEVYYWQAEEAPVSGVHLLAGFDEYILGYRDRSLVLNPAHADLVVPGKNGVFKPLIVSEGRVVGTWSRRLKKACVEMGFDLFPGQEVALEALHAAAGPYAQFLGLEPRFL